MIRRQQRMSVKSSRVRRAELEQQPVPAGLQLDVEARRRLVEVAQLDAG